MQKKFSISFIILLIFLLVFIFFVAPMTMYSYKNFQKALTQNIENYLKQVKNITYTIFEQEVFILQTKASELSSLITNTSLDVVEDMNVSSNIVTDDIDILFIQTKGGIKNLSNSLFDTQAIIKKLMNQQSKNGCIQNVVVNNETISLLLQSQKMIDNKSGKVLGSVYVGKILNENLTFLNKIVQKAGIQAISLYINQEIISTTFELESSQNQLVENIDYYLKEETLYENYNSIFTKLPLECNGTISEVAIIPVINSNLFKSLKDDYHQQIMILLCFFIFVGITTFFLIRKFIIYPMYRLLAFARDIKQEKKEYPTTIIQEYAVLAKGLENVINELRDVKEQYTLAVDGTQEGLFDWNIDQDEIYFSKRTKSILGFKEYDDLSLKVWSQYIYKKDKIHLNQHLIEHLKQKVEFFEDEFRFQCQDGNYKWFRIKAKALFNEKKHAYRMLGFIADIDHLKQLEAENKAKESYILEQSKIAAMTDMLSNIAHQWRQPLSVITSIASSIKLQLQIGELNKEDIHKDLDLINQTSQKMSQTIESFKDSYELEHKQEQFNLNEALLNNIKILEPAYTYNNIIFLTKTFNIEYYGYKDEFLLILNKLLQNAKEAIANQKIKNGYIFVQLSEIDSSEIVLKVYDNAKGIDENIKDKIFEPYFTTKHKAQGVGLSLYVAKNIVTKYFKGSITFHNMTYEHNNEMYTGACFTIRFPKVIKEK